MNRRQTVMGADADINQIKLEQRRDGEVKPPSVYQIQLVY